MLDIELWRIVKAIFTRVRREILAKWWRLGFLVH